MSGHNAKAPKNRETAKWDPSFTKQVADTVGPLIKRWHRAEVRNIDNIPPPVEPWWCPTTPAAC